MRIRVHGATDIGRKRSINEDNYKICPKMNLFIVADGMGGHIAGEIASRLAVDIIAEAVQFEFESLRDNDRLADFHPGHLLDKAIQLANRKILETAQKRPELEGMGTTTVAALVHHNTLHIASVGDSRIYRVRDHEISQLTSDHSWVNMQVRLGNMTAEEARYHPMRNVITRALGTQLEVEIDIMAHLIRHNDVVLLCTDGLSNSIQMPEIAQQINERPDLESATESLIQIANERGGDDNITAVLLQFDYEGDPAVRLEDDEQDTEIIPVQRIKSRLQQSRFPKRPP